jgi:hypothetical protein
VESDLTEGIRHAIISLAQQTTRGGAVAARRAHNPKVPGSSPGPATNDKKTACAVFLFMSLLRKLYWCQPNALLTAKSASQRFLHLTDKWRKPFFGLRNSKQTFLTYPIIKL